MSYVGFGGVEEHACGEGLGPNDLYLDDELAAMCILTLNSDNAVSDEGCVGNVFCSEVFYGSHLPVGGEGQERVYEAYGEVFVLSEHLYEWEVGFGVEVHHGCGVCGQI